MILKLSIIAPLLAGLLAGCTAAPQTRSENPGFPDDHAALAPRAEHGDVRYWQASGVALAEQYRKRVLLEPPRLVLSEGSGLDFTAREIDTLLFFFQRQLRRELLSNGYEMVGQPEPQALRIQLSVTGLKRTPQADAAEPQAGDRFSLFFDADVKDAMSGAALARSTSFVVGGELADSRIRVEDLRPVLASKAREARERLDRAFQR
ncbi:DUF3313 family protein [Pseudomonas sp. BN102]|uniref:DUF3313 family protein n=1 Tax=Pseudomonas sp. BN102 TaxID=2567886 RepID=UPI002454BAFE|nr:DUF3313 family protein [Pseudomonas sp. BN102]MDH4612444.1 DUF3313 domain-containing protein [Pseudomonas sp. BN102]